MRAFSFQFPCKFLFKTSQMVKLVLLINFFPLQITTQVALVLLGGAASLLIVPFKYILAFLLFDLFTRELEFRREMVLKFRTFLKERWASVHAAPVVVLPYEGSKSSSNIAAKDTGDETKSAKVQKGRSTVNSHSSSTR